VRLPADASARSELLAYARSTDFAASVLARAGTNGPGAFEIEVVSARNTGLVGLRATSRTAGIATPAANIMVMLLKEYAAKHELGDVHLVDTATGPAQ